MPDIAAAIGGNMHWDMRAMAPAGLGAVFRGRAPTRRAVEVVRGGFEPRLDDAERHHGHRRHRSNGVVAATAHFEGRGGQAVCVRLCDGFFFPLPTMAGDGPPVDGARCNSLCPDAPTEVYYMTSGSDLVEDAVSATGARYTALPIALRYRTTADNACSCRRSGLSETSVTRDPTLRKNDLVMTAAGFRVFRGARRIPYEPKAFATMRGLRLPATQRAVLSAMERVSLIAPPSNTIIRTTMVAAAPQAVAFAPQAIAVAARSRDITVADVRPTKGFHITAATIRRGGGRIVSEN